MCDTNFCKGHTLSSEHHSVVGDKDKKPQLLLSWFCWFSLFFSWRGMERAHHIQCNLESAPSFPFVGKPLWMGPCHCKVMLRRQVRTGHSHINCFATAHLDTEKNELFLSLQNVSYYSLVVHWKSAMKTIVDIHCWCRASNCGYSDPMISFFMEDLHKFKWHWTKAKILSQQSRLQSIDLWVLFQ